MKEVKIVTEWNLQDLYDPEDPDFSKYRKSWKKATELFASKWKKERKYLTSPKLMLEALNDYESWCDQWGRAGNELYYYWLKKNLDMNNPQTKANFLKTQEFVNLEIEDLMRFFEISIREMPKERQEMFMKSKELTPYHKFLKRNFEKNRYCLSEKEEKIFDMKENSSYSAWVDMVNGLLLKEEREVLEKTGKRSKKNFPEIMSLMSDSNKKVRDDAAQVFNQILQKNVEVAEAEINAILTDYESTCKLRGYTYPAQPRHLSDDISPAMVDSLKQAVKKRYALAHRYYALRAKLMGVKKLAYHERNIPFHVKEKSYSHREGFELVHKVFSNLNNELVDIMEKLSSEGRIDAYPKKGKQDGGFSIHFLKSQPSFILLNSTDKLRDVTTLAHELGHAINNELVKKHQNSLYFDESLATAEVASTFMEGFVFKELLKEADEELKLSLLVERLNDEINTIIRQIACYCFEEDLHTLHKEKGYISHAEIGKLFQKHMGSYMGPSVEQSPGSENWWIYWSHIRRFFYVYSYASGLLISKALQRKVEEDHSFIEKVKIFLSTGVSKSPKETFRAMELDIENPAFWEEGLEEMEKSLNEIEKLAKKLKKI